MFIRTGAAADPQQESEEGGQHHPAGGQAAQPLLPLRHRRRLRADGAHPRLLLHARLQDGRRLAVRQPNTAGNYNSCQRDFAKFHNARTRKIGPTFSLLKMSTSAFTVMNLVRH